MAQIVNRDVRLHTYYDTIVVFSRSFTIWICQRCSWGLWLLLLSDWMKVGLKHLCFVGSLFIKQQKPLCVSFLLAARISCSRLDWVTTLCRAFTWSLGPCYSLMPVVSVHAGIHYVPILMGLYWHEYGNIISITILGLYCMHVESWNIITVAQFVPHHVICILYVSDNMFACLTYITNGKNYKKTSLLSSDILNQMHML